MWTPHELRMIPTPSYTLSVQSFNWGRYTHLHIYTDNTSWTADRYTHLHIHNVYTPWPEDRYTHRNMHYVYTRWTDGRFTHQRIFVMYTLLCLRIDIHLHMHYVFNYCMMIDVFLYMYKSYGLRINILPYTYIFFVQSCRAKNKTKERTIPFLGKFYFIRRND